VFQKRFISLALFVALSLGAFSQYYYSRLSSSFNMPRTQYVVDSTTGNLLFKPGDLGFTMQVGTGFAGNFKGNSSFSTYVSPALAYNISPRFRLKAGVTVFQNFGDPYYAGYDGYYSPVISSGTTTSVFVQGDYLLSNKLMLSGTFYKDFNSFNSNVSDPRLKTPESQGIILNLNYRPTSSFEINASFGYGNGTRSAFNSPFYPGTMFPGDSPW
jgi:hypothetical protein